MVKIDFKYLPKNHREKLNYDKIKLKATERWVKSHICYIPCLVLGGAVWRRRYPRAAAPWWPSPKDTWPLALLSLCQSDCLLSPPDTVSQWNTLQHRKTTNDVQLIYSRATLPPAKTLIKACGALCKRTLDVVVICRCINKRLVHAQVHGECGKSACRKCINHNLCWTDNAFFILMDHFNFCTAARSLRYFQVTRYCTINLDSINYRSAEHTSTSGLIGLANIARRGSFLFTKLIREDRPWTAGAQMLVKLIAVRFFWLEGNYYLAKQVDNFCLTLIFIN